MCAHAKIIYIIYLPKVMNFRNTYSIKWSKYIYYSLLGMQIPVLIPFIFTVLSCAQNKNGLFFFPPLRLLNRDIHAFLLALWAHAIHARWNCAFCMHLKWYHGIVVAAAALALARLVFSWLKACIEANGLKGKVYNTRIANTKTYSHTQPQNSQKIQYNAQAHIAETHIGRAAALTMCMCFYVWVCPHSSSSFSSARSLLNAHSLSLSVCVCRCTVSVCCVALWCSLTPNVCMIYIFQRFRLRIKAIPKRARCVYVTHTHTHRTHIGRESHSQAQTEQSTSQPLYNTAHWELFQ